MHRTTLTFSCTAALAAALPSPAEAQAFSITRSVIATGGGTSSGGVFSVTGTTGETGSGSLLCYGGKFDLASGFWAGRPAVVWPEPRPLGVTVVAGGYTTGVEWRPSRPGWRVEYSRDLIQWATVLSPTAELPLGALTVVASGPVAPRVYWRLVRLPN